MKKFIYLFLLLLLIHSSSAQNISVDSMFSVLKNLKEDTSRVNTLNRIADSFRNNPDTAIYFSKEAMTLSGKLNYTLGIADAHKNLAQAFSNMGNNTEGMKEAENAVNIYNQLAGKNAVDTNYISNQLGKSYGIMAGIFLSMADYPKAIENNQHALKLFLQTGYRKGIAGIYNSLASIYMMRADYTEGLKYYFAALKIKEEIGDKRGIANALGNLGYVYAVQKLYDDALEYYNKSLKTAEEIDDARNICYAYEGIGNIYFFQGKYDDALRTFMLLLKKYEAIGEKNGIAACYISFGNIYNKMDNTKEALKYYLMALKLNEEMGDRNGVSGCLNNIGTIYVAMKLYDKAYNSFNRALSIGKEIGNIDNIMNCYENLAYADSAQGNFKGSLVNYKLYIATRDSIVNRENTRKTVEAQMNYEFDKKSALSKADQEKKDALTEKEFQKQKLVKNGFVSGFAVVLLLAGVFFTQRNRIKKGKERSDELLLNILPEEIANELKAKGNADAKQYDDVTVMFTDFKDFTNISETLSPTELVFEIDSCFKAFDMIISKHNIEKIKTIGDSYMCAGGLPVTNTTNAIDLINASLEILEFMKEYVAKKRAQGKLPFEIRIGIHSGPVVAGIVGVKKFAYDIWGDTVNIASRMESSGEVGKINISGSTFESVKDVFNCTYRGKIEAKNKGMVDMYFVEGKKS